MIYLSYNAAAVIKALYQDFIRKAFLLNEHRRLNVTPAKAMATAARLTLNKVIQRIVNKPLSLFVRAVTDVVSSAALLDKVSEM